MASDHSPVDVENIPGEFFYPSGFPFDGDGMMSRGRPDFRHRLEELAQQHPEFADSLRPWYANGQPANDMGWGFRQRTGSGSTSNSASPQTDPHQSQPHPQPHAEPQGQEQPEHARGGGIPQHGLRNTVDIGQAQAQLDAQTQEERGKRAQSAPPAADQRFVSRLDMNPVPAGAGATGGHGQDAAPAGAAAKPPTAPKQPHPAAGASQPQQQQPKQGGNVRQIPIFVEGRDEPVIAKHDVDSSPSYGQGFPQQPHHPFSRSGAGGPGGIHDSVRFGDAPRYTSSAQHQFVPHQAEREREQGAPKRPFPQQQPQTPPTPPTRQQARQFQQKQQAAPPPQPQPQPQQQPRQQTPPPAPREQVKPLDPLEKVLAVQKDVADLAVEVKAFSGQKQDKQYLYLDEMLTRNLIKLDVIETEGRDDVRIARKETIRSIQKCISELESKNMAPEQQQQAMEVEAQSEPQASNAEAGAGAAPEQMEAEPIKTEETKTESAPGVPPLAPAPAPVPTPDAAAAEPAPVQTPVEAAQAVTATPSQDSSSEITSSSNSSTQEQTPSNSQALAAGVENAASAPAEAPSAPINLPVEAS